MSTDEMEHRVFMWHYMVLVRKVGLLQEAMCGRLFRCVLCLAMKSRAAQ